MLRSSARSMSSLSTLTRQAIPLRVPELFDEPLDAREDAEVERRGSQRWSRHPARLDQVVHPRLQLADLLLDSGASPPRTRAP